MISRCVSRGFGAVKKICFASNSTYTVAPIQFSYHLTALIIIFTLCTFFSLGSTRSFYNKHMACFAIDRLNIALLSDSVKDIERQFKVTLLHLVKLRSFCHLRQNSHTFSLSPRFRLDKLRKLFMISSRTLRWCENTCCDIVLR
jgi:hypothetical protein